MKKMRKINKLQNDYFFNIKNQATNFICKKEETCTAPTTPAQTRITTKIAKVT